MKKILLLASVLSSVTVLAQPTINSSDLKPEEGEKFIITSSSTYLDVSAGGSNQTWDLSSLVAGTSANLRATIPNSSATQVDTYENEEGIICHTYTSTGVHLVKLSGVNAPTSQLFSDTKLILPLPLTSSSTATDTYSASATFQGITSGVNGDVSISVEGYGTVTTPFATFNNVLLVKTVDTYNTTANGNINGANQVTSYAFYKAGMHQPVATMFKSGPDNNPTYSSNFLSSYSLGLEDLNNVVFAIAPNPAFDGFKVQGDYTIESVTMFDINSKAVAVQFDTASNYVDISNLNAGVYQLHVKSAVGTSVQKIVKR